MRESIGYTATLNIAIVFITIVFGFIFVALNYYRAYKVSNVITNEIEKYEGYNELAQNSIKRKLYSLGYGNAKMSCRTYNSGSGENCSSTSLTTGEAGYCVYECKDEAEEYTYYKVGTNMFMLVPYVGDILNIPIYSTTNELYDFEAKFGTVE